MSAQDSKGIIKSFYQFLNASQYTDLFSLIDDNVLHEINYRRIKGKDNYREYINSSKYFYDEQIDDYLLMLSDDGHQATTKLTVKGRYVNTDDSLIPAIGQFYELPMIHYFEIRNDRIVRGGCWFDQNDWVRQISSAG